MKKRKKINYFQVNKWSILFLIGIFFIILCFLLGLIFEEYNSLIKGIQMFAFVIVYLGLMLHLRKINGKPFSKSWNFIKESKDLEW